MKKTMSITSKLVVASVLVVFLGGCLDKIKEKFTGSKTQETLVATQNTDDKIKNLGPVLVYIDKEPVLYQKEFEGYLAQMLQMYPQLKGLMTVDSLPEPMKKNVLQKLVDQKLIIAWGKKNNVEQDEEFVKSLDEALKMIKDHLMIQQFEKRMSTDIEATDSDVRAEFNKNKKKYVKTLGGTTILGVKFKNDADAADLLNKAKGKEDQFKEIVKIETKEKVKDFGKVSEDTSLPGLPKEVKEVAITITKFPALKTVKSGKFTWVICAPDKVETEYLEFDEVKGQIEEMIRNEQTQKAIEKKIGELKKEYTVEIREELLSPTSPDAEEAETTDDRKASAVAA